MTMKFQPIITVGRQYGSGGRYVAKLLSERLGIPFYDKELLVEASKDSGICQEVMENYDEKQEKRGLFSMLGGYQARSEMSMYLDIPLNHRIFLAQFDTIRRIADEGPCVIVGRCADYALADYENCIHLFIYADEEARTKRVMEKYQLSEYKAQEMINKKDKQRQSYYNYYSSKKWGRADSYDLCINSSVLGVDGTVKLIIQYVEDFEKRLAEKEVEKA